jgi:AraC family transcriptional regulator
LRPAQRQRLNRFIDDHIAEAIAPADLARECELSLDYFSRIFRRTYGVAPRTWLIRERMRQAATRLVETDRTVAQVAHEFGVDNLSLFCRQFRSVMGCTPTVYRAGRGAAE